MLAPARKALDSVHTSVHNVMPVGIRTYFYHENSVVQQAKPFFAVVGGATVLYLSVKWAVCIGKAVTSYCLAGPLKLGADLKKVGDWAVVTGGSDGIGKEFAFQLAQKGLNIVLIARSIDKLEGVAREITAKYNVQTKIIAIDLSKMGPHNVPQMQEELKDLNIAILVNSAGALGSIGKFLTTGSDEEVANIINLNARATVMMSRAVMPLLISKKQPNQKKYVIMVGAILGGARPAPGAAVYGATKAFMDSFAQAVHHEYKGQNICVQSFIPGATKTKMLPLSMHKSNMVPTPNEVVTASLAQLGVRSRTFGHWKHGIMLLTIMASRFHFGYSGNLPLVPQIDRVLAPVVQFKSYLAAAGALYLGYKSAQALYCLGRGVFSYALANPLHLGPDLRKVGEWAVVTGSSDGMGKEWAFQLAAKGLNVILVARNQEKTEKVAQEIRSIHKVLARTIIIDLAQISVDDVKNLQDQLRTLRIAVLVNNAGLYFPEEKFLANPVTDEKAVEMITVNITALVLITRAVLPLLIAQGSGYIVNISSLLGEKPVKGSALYAAGKTFVDYFSQSLDWEYRDKGVHVQSAMVGMVRTALLPLDHHKSPFTADAAAAIRNAIGLIGVRQRHHTHWKHALMSHLVSCLPVIDLLKK
ncbi:uncharacterized protein LOC129591408 [Paramacrobiotus metropolitanus]|uniref:uncharacterized protein LOC129591408 n=1 Tax=Paramacrobiotus metropolitanus TaxID=2943436 RepID=UPI002445D368|nr:uncharacterized protein LOC129591408 [Paramacrobiotus metropolitanus]